MSEEQRVRNLLSEEELGDRRLSQFLRDLRSLAGVALQDENILRQLWMRRLPQHVQAILATQGDISLDKVSTLADKVCEITGPQVHAYSSASPPQATTSLDSLVKSVEELRQQVAALTVHHQSSRSRSQSRSNQPRSRSTTPASKQCWYHRRFGSRATKCISPCAWVSENPNNNQ